MPRGPQFPIHLDRLHRALERPQRQQRAPRPRLGDIAAEEIDHLLRRKGQDLLEAWSIAIDPLGQNRRRRLAERTPHTLEAHGADAVHARLGLQIHRDEVTTTGIAARDTGISVGERADVPRATIMVHQPGETHLPIHQGFSMGALTTLPHSVHEPS